MRRPFARLRLRRTELLVSAIVIAAAGAIIGFVEFKMHHIRDALPEQVLTEQRDVAYMLDDMAEILRAADRARLQRSPVHLERLRWAIARGVQRLAEIRHSYNFDNYIGASAMHALLNPALEDMQRWLRDGQFSHAPDSALVLGLVELRARDAYRRERVLFDHANQTALELVKRERMRLESFRDALALYLAAFALFALGTLALFVRQRNAQARIARLRERLEESIENLSEGFALYDARDRLLLSNRRYRLLAGRRTGAEDPDTTAAGGADRPGEFTTADQRIIRVSERPMRGGGRVGVYTDITDLRRAQWHLEHLASHDPLTGLPNRAHLDEYLDASIARAARRGVRLALLFFDLDHFKFVNDTYGHAAGDELLVQVAREARQVLRRGEMLARLGGDEFTAVIEDVEDEDSVAQTAQRLREAISTRFVVGGAEVSVDTSIGIALYPGDGVDRATLLGNADTACYHAKASGRGQFQFFTDSMNSRTHEHVALAERLRLAVERGELRLLYQPQFTLPGRALTGMEALVRWHDPEFGEIPPAKFIPLAEETGMIEAIGRWVLETACRQLCTWREADIDAVGVSVNFSARQFRRPGLLDLLHETISATGVEPRRVTVELTEASVMEHPATARATLDGLHRLGVGVAIDEFGVGYSSLAALKHPALTTLKIDPRVIGEIDGGGNDGAFIGAIIAMAHALGLRVVAVGVENDAQLRRLEALGCDRAQGYGLGAPTDAGQATEALLRASGERVGPGG